MSRTLKARMLKALFVLSCWCLPMPYGAAAAAQNCHFLNVNVSTIPSGLTVTVPDFGVNCSQGNFVSDNPSSSNVSSVTTQQGDVSGPNCTYTFQITSGSNIYTYKIVAQQNFCALEAGKITTSVLFSDGVVSLTSTEGSYAQNLPGQVYAVLSCPECTPPSGQEAAPKQH